MCELDYPFNSQDILRKHKQYKKLLLEKKTNYIEKKVAILGGSTTNTILNCLDLFLLNYGIKATFYESSYNKYFEDAVFFNQALNDFQPDIIYIFTSFRNILSAPSTTDSTETINEKISLEYNHYLEIWKKLKEKYNAIIIQNNFEMPNYRLLGNKDASSPFGFTNYIQKINNVFYEYSNANDNFYILDLNYISANFGLEKWHDEQAYALYKYAMNINAMPTISFNVANIIKSIYGKNKKAIVLDLDNTLWGGIIGDDGLENIKIGPEGGLDEMYLSFQKYIKKQKELGTILNIASKNDEAIALAGLENSDGILKKNDFILTKINWESKDKNILDIANELQLGADSFVFIDDNPAERELVKENINGISTPNIDTINNYINIIDKSGFFENTILSKEDIQKNKIYKENILRTTEQNKFTNYDEYLDALQMHATIKSFDKQNIPRISQLTNKSNQFNLTTKRYQDTDIAAIIDNNEYITLYCKLKDKFGDNGIISLIIGKIDNNDHTLLHIDLWVMSCRVLKRDVEYAMMNELITQCKKYKIKTIEGCYIKTTKNNLVSNFYDNMGFDLIEEKEQNKKYIYVIDKNQTTENKHIHII